MEIGNASDSLSINAGVLGHLFGVAIISSVPFLPMTHRKKSRTYASKSLFMLEPIVLLYTSLPSQELCKWTELTSKFQGLAHSTAAFNWQ
jgi:hypothetical protein